MDLFHAYDDEAYTPIRKATVESDSDCQNTKLQCTTKSTTLAHINILSIWRLKFLFVLFSTRNITVLTNFCNSEIPGFRVGKNGRDPGIPVFGIPGLQSLLETSDCNPGIEFQSQDSGLRNS